jgi:hypothetical protein
VILQKLFKLAFKQEFNVHTTNNIDKQLDVKEAKDINLDFCMFILKPLLCSWLFQAWQPVNRPNMIKRECSMCGLEQAFNKTFQTCVMDKHMKNPLFKEIPFEKEVDSKGENKI